MKKQVDADLLRRMDRVLAYAENNGEKRLAKIVRNALVEANAGNPAFVEAIARAKRIPVTIEEFISSKDFLGQIYSIWPVLVDDLIRINPDVLAGEPPVIEALLGGATGTGKTTLAIVTNLYQIYCLTCFPQPQLLFPGLSRVTPIVFLFQSVSTTVTRRVIYQPLRRAFVAMPYTERYVNYDKQLEAAIRIEGGIEAYPAVAMITAMVGQAVIGGIVDEINFMAVVERSRQVTGPDGTGGRFDQAEEVYSNLSRRRKSRFAAGQLSFGVLVISSSVRYRDDFMDRRLRQVETEKPVGIVAIRRKQYEVHPEISKITDRFRFFCGTDNVPPRVLRPDEPDPEGRVEYVPSIYLSDFQRDPEGAMRDIIGIASNAVSAFIPRRDRIIESFRAWSSYGGKSWTSMPGIDLSVTQNFPDWLDENMPAPEERQALHYAHLDLSVTGDRVGIAIARVLGYEELLDPQTNEVEIVPKIAVPFVFYIQPSTAHPVDFQSLRSWLVGQVKKHKINLVQVTFDTFQSIESQQAFRRLGITSGPLSVDRDPEPYLFFRRMLYADKLVLQHHDLLFEELAKLEWQELKRKVDHPPRGSKDVADAVCGAVWACAQSREVRAGLRSHPKSNPHALRPVRPAPPRPPGRKRGKV